MNTRAVNVVQLQALRDFLEQERDEYDTKLSVNQSALENKSPGLSLIDALKTTDQEMLNLMSGYEEIQRGAVTMREIQQLDWTGYEAFRMSKHASRDCNRALQP